jgi:hypothetical protein
MRYACPKIDHGKQCARFAGNAVALAETLALLLRRR